MITVNTHLVELVSEKNTLLQEIHHRVKNNLSLINNPLLLKSNNIATESDAISAFHESQKQIYAIALVHEQLYQSENLSKIEMNVYFEKLIRSLIVGFSRKKQIKSELKIDAIQLKIGRAIPCGIIVNELVTNSIKHAFSGIKNAKINFMFSLNNENIITLVFRDNGTGIDPTYDIKESSSLGFQIVKLQAPGFLDLAPEKLLAELATFEPPAWFGKDPNKMVYRTIQEKKRCYSYAPYYIEHWSFNRENCTAIVQRARSYGVSLHCFLGAVLLKSFAKEFGSEQGYQRTIQYPVNLRNYLTEADRKQFGVFVGILTSQHDCSLDRPIVEIA